MSLQQKNYKNNSITFSLIINFSIFIISCLIPTTFFYVFQTSSQAFGVAVSAILLIGLSSLGIANRPSSHGFILFLISTLIFLIFIFTHGLIASILQNMQFIRLIQSIILLGFMIIGGYFISYSVFRNDEEIIIKSAGYFTLFFIFIGVLGILGIRPLESAISNNPVFPFTEPSHYAITFMPFLLFLCVIIKTYSKILLLILTLIIAFFLQSLSLVTGILIIAVIVMDIRLVAIGFAVLITAAGFLDLTYFSSRLNFGYDSNNLSALIYLQGWELSFDSIYRSFGWGIGFQQLGYGDFNSPAADIVFRLLGNDANLKDGGFMLAKATSELGIFGFAGILVLSAMAGKAGWNLRQIATRRKESPASAILAMSVICGYVLEIFVRGIGYFSGSAMLLIGAIIYTTAIKNLSALPSGIGRRLE